jgi:putative two-component system response regulator
VGKIGIPDRILLKPGRYEPEEYAVMKAHPKLGHDAIVRAQITAGEDIEFFEVAKEIVYCHHEKWDGSGYPQGLVGEAIPIAARLMALADVYDALMSRRVYKMPMSLEQTTQLLRDGRGTHFDPDVVDAYLACMDQFAEISKRFADPHSAAH